MIEEKGLESRKSRSRMTCPAVKSVYAQTKFTARLYTILSSKATGTPLETDHFIAANESVRLFDHVMDELWITPIFTGPTRGKEGNLEQNRQPWQRLQSTRIHRESIPQEKSNGPAGMICGSIICCKGRKSRTTIRSAGLSESIWGNVWRDC